MIIMNRTLTHLPPVGINLLLLSERVGIGTEQKIRETDKGLFLSGFPSYSRIHPSYKKGFSVNKSELIEAVAASADIPKAAAGRAVDAVVEAVTNALKSEEQVVLVGFGTFSVKDRAARTGRNPQTGAPIEIAAAKIPSFKAGKALKDAVNN